LPPCLIGMEACSGAHHWAREFSKFGHTVRLMAPVGIGHRAATQSHHRAPPSGQTPRRLARMVQHCGGRPPRRNKAVCRCAACSPCIAPSPSHFCKKIVNNE
jgi:hypothetical protein